MNADEPNDSGPPGGTPGILRRNGWALLAATAVTIGVELGMYWLAMGLGVGARQAVLATLAVSVLWVALAAGALAAGSDGGWGMLLRGGIVADASAVSLAVLAVASPYVTLLAAAQVYCTLAAMALFSTAVVACAAGRGARLTAAAATAVVLMAALSTPLWIGGALRAEASVAGPIASTAALVNPFYSVTSAVVEQTHFVWHQARVMYQITWLGDLAAPAPVPWYAAAIVYGVPAALLWGLRRVLRGFKHSQAVP